MKRKTNQVEYTKFLNRLAEEIDIPPSKHHEAETHYRAVGKWLDCREYFDTSESPSIYTQGSFRLGTVVRPIREGVELDYDIDLVCELPIQKSNKEPRSLKLSVGRRLKENENYRRMLDEEGKRCWTLLYAEKDGIGFHLDVLPAVFDPSNISQTAIAITNKQDNTYLWSASDPNGYVRWFESKNMQAFKIFSAVQKRDIQSRSPLVFASVDDVPDYLVRTPLQRAIQIMKRHRDLYFTKSKSGTFAPISVIITTLAAKLYTSERDVFSALRSIVTKLYAYTELMSGSTPQFPSGTPNLIERSPDGTWRIVNPVNPEENFADRWHEDGNQRAQAFFSWVEALKTDLIDVLQVDSPDVLNSRTKTALGISATALNLELINPAPHTDLNPSRVNVSSDTKPWGCGVRGPSNK